jgi:glycosyltransferase involved in cell wall biosynthesis
MFQNCKIIYVTSTRFPTEKAHGLSTVKICEAFSDLGCSTDVIAPLLWRKNSGDIFKYYGVKNNFRVFKVFCIDLIPLKKIDEIAFLLQSISFSLSAVLFIIFKYKTDIKNFIFFSHDYIPLYFMTFLPGKVFYDIHHFPGNNFMYKRVIKKSFGFAVQTKWKVDELVNKFGVPLDKIIYWPNGTDVDKFHIEKSTMETRAGLSVPVGKKIIMYTGQLFGWKGVDSLIKAVKLLPEDVLIYIVGGAEEDVARCRKEISEASDERVIFIPFQPHEKMPEWLHSADILVLPNTGKQKVSLYYTSPMKLFEYMASGKPIVASAVPSIMEILNEENSVLVKPDNPDDLARGIELVLKDEGLVERMTRNSTSDSRKYTWHVRVQKIKDYFRRYA